MLPALLLAAAAYVLPPGTYPFRTYGVESGLGNLSAIRIVQDSTGFLWVATQDGAYRYDGNRFRRFGLEEGLPSTFVGSMSAGPRGELWAATGAGVVRFDGNRFHLIDALPHAAANAISTDPGGRLWVAMQQGLFAGTERAAGWEGGATAVWCGGDDVWAASTGVVGRLTNGVWTRWNLEPRERIDSVVADARGRVWARSGNYLWSFNRDGSDVRDESAALPATSNNGYLSLDARGELWVPTDRGIAFHDASGWRVIGAAQGLPTEWARNVFEDREGSIWVASLGVHRMLGRGELVSYKRGNGLPNEVTWCFRWDRDGHLLVGTDLGLARSAENGWTVVAGTERSQIRTVIEEENGVLWAGGSPPEVIRIDPATRSVRRFGEADGVHARAILRLMRARDGAIWAATRGGGLLRKGPGEERFARVEIPGGDAEEDFRDVIEDRSGRVWAGGQRGLARFADGRWSRLTTKDGLRHDHVAYIMEAASGDFWIAYFEPLGLARMRADGLENPSHIRVVERLDASNGIAANKIFIIGEDKGGRLWVGGGAGIDVVGRAQVEHFGTADGLAGDDTDAMAFLCDARGHVFVGTSSGFSYYVPRADPPRRGPLAVAITSSTRGAQSRDFAATFSALTYFKPDIVEYEARLAGLDDAWERVSEPRAHWSRLPPGNYRFEVRARLRPGPWSAPAAMSFDVLPAWWQTTSARAGAVVVFALLIWLVYRWRVAFLRRRNRELEALVAQRTRELADLSVTDALTGLKNRRFLQLCMPEFTSMALRRHEVLSRAGVDPTRANGDLVCLLLDLDHFKDVNDRHGHRIGDEVLVSLCELLGSLRRESDAIVRWGGEELLYLARDASRAEATVIAERIRSAVEQHEFRVGDGTVIRMTCSIGFAAYPFLPEDARRVSWEEVLDIADICLYAAKNAGRNCWTGVVVRDCLAPDTLMARMRQSMPSLVAAGELEMLTSARSRSSRTSPGAGA